MEEISKYDLTEEEFLRCLKLAEIQIFMRSERKTKPQSVFIISQAGGGKTGLKKFVESQAKDIFIEINPDEVAVYHKYYSEILREFPKESHMQLQKFVQPALDNYLRQRAVQLRNNLMQEGTFGNTDGYLEILDFQKNGGKAPLGKVQPDGKRESIDVKGGYDIEIDILAVDRFESLLSSYEREQYFIEAGLPPRAVTQVNHDRSYDNLIKTVGEIEKRKLYDRMRVFKRGKIESKPELVHTAGDGRYPSVVECIKQTRDSERRKLLANPTKYLGRIQKLKNRVTSEIQMRKIEELENEFNLCLEQQKQKQEQK